MKKLTRFIHVLEARNRFLFTILEDDLALRYNSTLKAFHVKIS
jgi:hypothetical protein